jgi:foldase protein PrsA
MLYWECARQPEDAGRFRMRNVRLLLPLFAALLLGLGLGCGGGGDEDVPDDAVAIVGDDEIAKSEFDELLSQAKRSYQSQKRPFPKAGSGEYNTLKTQAIQFLVQKSEFEQKAEDLDVEVSDKQVAARLAQIKKQYFEGNEDRYRKQLKQQGLTDDGVRDQIRSQLLSEEIFKKVTEDVKVTDKEISAYYKKNTAQYGQPESREVRHILVKNRKQANRLYDRLQGGANFAGLARQFSQDPGSKALGGKLTVSRGQTVPPFDQTAFLLPKGKISRPVKSQYGYHIIQPLSEVRPAKTTPLKDVKDSIRQQLLQNKRNEAMTKWVEKMRKDFADDISYQVGYAPPKTQTTGTTTESK